MSYDRDAKNAEVVLKLIADSGYVSVESARISANQWARILKILAE